MIGICIVTYNQEEYISQCIDSALSQICSEKIRIYVANDASTDATESICREYGGKIVLVNRSKNLGLVKNTIELLKQIEGDGCEYIAMLDGDDYWQDPYKIQKQIDFLAKNPNVGLIHTCVDILTPNGFKFDKRQNEHTGNFFTSIENYTIGNCSVLYKSELLKYINYQEICQQGLFSLDYVMYSIFSAHTDFGFIPDHTAVWRRGHQSVSFSSDMERQIKYIDNDLAVWRYLACLFPNRWTFTKEQGDRYFHLKSFRIAFLCGNRDRALSESRLLSQSDKRNNWIRIIICKSKILMSVSQLLKKI